MEYAFLFFILILFLFFLSRRLTSEVFNLFFKLTKSESASIHILAIIFFPGVFVHELSHYLAAKFLFVNTGKISFFPKKEGDYVKLGSVSIEKSNFVKEFLIALAPLISGISLILLLVFLLLQDFQAFDILKIVFSIILIFLISNTMYTSRRDMQAALPFLVTVLTLGIILIILNFRFPVINYSQIPSIDLNRIFYMGSLYLGIPILIDLIVILVFRFFDRMW